MKKEIFKIMTHEHEIIETLLNELKRSKNEKKSERNKIFHALMWNIEKHILLEERLLATMDIVWKNKEGMLEILEEHEQIRDLIKQIKSTYFYENNIIRLKEVIRDHFVLEETFLYPTLERILNLQEKRSLMDRTKEPLN